MWVLNIAGQALREGALGEGRECAGYERRKKVMGMRYCSGKGFIREGALHLFCMDSDCHDTHAAYVSHISHITSFALANTVLEKEKEGDAILLNWPVGVLKVRSVWQKIITVSWVPIFYKTEKMH